MSEALEILERAAFTDAEMRAYDKFWDEVSSLRTIEGDWEDKLKETEAKAEKAVAEAEAEAELKMKQDKLDTARKLKAMNVMTTAQIAEATGLTTEEIDVL